MIFAPQLAEKSRRYLIALQGDVSWFYENIGTFNYGKCQLREKQWIEKWS